MMNENCVTIFALLEQSARLDAIDRLDDIAVASVPNMKEEDAQRVIKMYENQSKSKEELIDLDRDENAGEKLKGIFGEK